MRLVHRIRLRAAASLGIGAVVTIPAIPCLNASVLAFSFTATDATANVSIAITLGNVDGTGVYAAIGAPTMSQLSGSGSAVSNLGGVITAVSGLITGLSCPSLVMPNAKLVYTGNATTAIPGLEIYLNYYYEGDSAAFNLAAANALNV